MVGASTSSNVLSQKRRHSSEDKRLSTTLLDLNTFDCPICYEALTIPIFQCDENGHLACSSCCPKLNNKCPFCASPISKNRCRAMERVLESIFIPCPNAAFGCPKNLSYGKESSHEKECIFSPCTCPAFDCNYIASFARVENHFWEHRSKYSINLFEYGVPFSVEMRDKMSISISIYGQSLTQISDKMSISMEDEEPLFPVQYFREPCGVYVTISCLAPPSPKVGEFSYRLSYTVDGHTLTYESPKVKRVLEVSFQTPQENFMLIPHSLVRGELSELEICINKLKQV